MKKYLLLCLALLLTACQTFVGAKTNTTIAPEQLVVSEPRKDESVLDLALPMILANAEKNYSPVQTPPIIVVPGNTAILPEAVEQSESVSRQYTQEDIRCLAINIYHESRGEPVRGQAAVAWVVLNRVQSGKYARTVCGVVYQRSRKGCQFHWVCDRNPDKPRENKAYERALLIAEQVLRGEIDNPIGKRLSFHGTSYAGRYNAHRRPTKLVIGQHLFY